MRIGTILFDPLDMENIRRFLGEAITAQMAEGKVSYLLVEDRGDIRPALLAESPEIVARVIELIKQNSASHPELGNQTYGVHFLDCDPSKSWKEFPLVKVSQIIMVEAIELTSKKLLDRVSTFNYQLN